MAVVGFLLRGLEIVPTPPERSFPMILQLLGVRNLLGCTRISMVEMCERLLCCGVRHAVVYSCWTVVVGQFRYYYDFASVIVFFLFKLQ